MGDYMGDGSNLYAPIEFMSSPPRALLAGSSTDDPFVVSSPDMAVRPRRATQARARAEGARSSAPRTDTRHATSREG